MSHGTKEKIWVPVHWLDALSTELWGTEGLVACWAIYKVHVWHASCVLLGSALYGQVARKSSRPKSCRPKFIVMSPDILSHVARNFIMLKKILKLLVRVKLWNSGCLFRCRFHGDSKPKIKHEIKKTSNISYSMILTVVFICWSILFWKKVHITTIRTLEKAAILTTARAQESSHDC